MKNFNLENFLIDLEEALSPWNLNTGSTVHNGFDEFMLQENCHEEKNNCKQNRG